MLDNRLYYTQNKLSLEHRLCLATYAEFRNIHYVYSGILYLEPQRKGYLFRRKKVQKRKCKRGTW